MQKLDKEGINDVSYIRRLIAYGFDWYVGGVLASLPVILIYMMLNDEATIIPQNLSIFTYPYNILAGALSFLVAIFYYVVIPGSIFPGQTVGKKLMKLKIVQDDCQDASIKQLIFRQFVVILLLEGSVYGSSNMLHQLINIVSGVNFSGVYSYIGLSITAVSILLVVISKSKRALHDALSGTRVVYLNSIKYSNKAKKIQKRIKREVKLSNG